MRVIDLQIVPQTGGKVLRGTEIASFQKATRQHAKPQLNLVEPGAMFGGKVEHMLMARIAQESPPLSTPAEVFGNTGHLAKLGDQTADIEAPVGIEIIQHPVVTVHGGQLLDDMGQMGGEIRAGTGFAKIPYDLTRWHHKRGDQRACPMTNVLVLAFLRLPRFHRLCGVFALKNLHAGFFIAADHQTPLLKETAGIEI